MTDRWGEKEVKNRKLQEKFWYSKETTIWKGFYFFNNKEKVLLQADPQMLDTNMLGHLSS